MTNRARVTEVAPDHHSISIYVPEFNLRFNHFLIKDDEEPLLFHTGMKQMFPLVRDAVARARAGRNPHYRHIPLPVPPDAACPA